MLKGKVKILSPKSPKAQAINFEFLDADGKTKNIPQKSAHVLEYFRKNIGKSFEVTYGLNPDSSLEWIKNMEGRVIYGTEFAKSVSADVKPNSGPGPVQGDGHQHGGGNGDPMNYNATSPYNFVPLYDEVKASTHNPPQNQFAKDSYSGYMDYSVTNLTELYIRGHGSDKNSDFFSPGGVLQIPGSSVRGMVRNIFEIITQSKFTQFDDIRLFYRAIFGPSAFGRDYVSHFADSKKGNRQNGSVDTHWYKSRAAWLIKEGDKYVLLKPKDHDKYHNGYVQVSDHHGRINEMELSQTFRTHKIFVDCSKICNRNRRHQARRGGRREFDFKTSDIKAENVSFVLKPGYSEAELVVTGKMQNKHFHPIVFPPTKDKYEVDQEIFEIYRTDVSRHERADLLKNLKDKKQVPCFVLLDDNGKVTAFGHTPMFRFPYQKTIGAFVPEELRNEGVEDWTESVFGSILENVNDEKRDKIHAGRLSFGSAFHKDPVNSLRHMEGEKSPKILSSPKPTSFQLYLEQPDGVTKEAIETWEGNGPHRKVRGYKRYWHKSAGGWHEGRIIDDKQHTKIKAVRPNQTFKGRIWFENLSKEELGALYLALTLSDEHFHKLGMGKPLGLGTVQVKSDKVVAKTPNDLKSGYLSCLTRSEAVGCDNEFLNECVALFAAKIYETPVKNREEFWSRVNKEHIKELACMLERDRADPGQVKYMTIQGGRGETSLKVGTF